MHNIERNPEMIQATDNNPSLVARRSSLLLEIGTEEIPARFVRRGLEILRESLVQLLKKERLEYGSISEYATPRRLTVHIEDVEAMQKDKATETLGPPKKIAFDDKGQPTKAATGFAKSLNVDIDKLKIVSTDRGEYAAVLVEEKGKAAKDVLSEKLPELISGLQLPRTMRWGNSSLRFFRPIKWILALFGDETITFDLHGIKSSNVTYGHRFLSPSAVRLKNPSDYLPLLRNNHVIADYNERKKIISAGIQEIESDRNIKIHKDDELLDMVTFLVEFPTLVLGSFEDKYVDLPKELLVTVMRTHQKYFSTESESGSLLPTFIIVSNTAADNNDMVRKGAERVLRARLEDAKFYYAEDSKQPLLDYREKLRTVTFQEKLGTLYDKSERIKSLCSFIADSLNFPLTEKLLRAAVLSKADLVTGIVREFPELQGYMGMIYAMNSDEDKDVATAVYEHYQPRFAGDQLPSGEIGTIVSLADKIDNIASFFHLGLIPSGSEDPFALRRQAAGIINILQNKDYPVTLSALTDSALENLNVPADKKPSLAGQILQFFNQRLEGILLNNGYSQDIVNAALTVNELTMKHLRQRLDVLSDLKKNAGFPGLLTAAKRVYNILSKAQPGVVNEDLLTEPSEKELHASLERIRTGISGGNFAALLDFEKPVNAFFDSVLVMDKDDKIRNNRLALLFSVKDIFDSLGDFSKISEI